MVCCAFLRQIKKDQGGDQCIYLNDGRWDIEVKDKGARVRILRMSRSVGMMVNKLSNQPYAVIDPGAEEDILGGIGWYVVHFSERSKFGIHTI